MKTTLNLALAATLLFLTGCGSLAARWRGERGTAYPGVRLDAQHATHYTTEGEFIALFDIPLSAVVDTLFLPYDLIDSPPSIKAQTQQSAEAVGH
jgi:uncharacterized protein YceK